MCAPGCGCTYEDHLSYDDQIAISSAYMSSVIPNWRMLSPIERLPKELRDEILDYLVSEERVKIEVVAKAPGRARDGSVPGDVRPADEAMDVDESTPPPDRLPPGLSASLKYRPHANIRGVCRWMREAYDERAARWTTLVLEDSDLYNFTRVVIPPIATTVAWAELYLILFCHSCRFFRHVDGSCRAAAEVSRHKGWIEDVLCQLTHLRSVAIFVHLAHEDFQPGQRTALPCEHLVEERLDELRSLPRLQGLELCRYRFEEHQHFEGPKDVISRWKPRVGERVERARFLHWPGVGRSVPE